MSKELKDSMRSMTTTSHQTENLDKEEIIKKKKKERSRNSEVAKYNRNF